MEISLLPGEHLLWEGRPLRNRLFRPADAFIIPFSLLYIAFFVFWESGVLGIGGPGRFFALWGVLILVLGLYRLWGHFVARALSTRSIRYAVTDRRVVVHMGWSGKQVITEYVKDLPPPVITELADGSGSLAFGSFPRMADAFALMTRRHGLRAWVTEPSLTPILRDVADVRRVRDFVAYAQSQR